jgi:hypothetical protein
MSNNTLDGGMMANIWSPQMNIDPAMMDPSGSAAGPGTSQTATTGAPSGQATGGSGQFVPQFGRG